MTTTPLTPAGHREQAGKDLAARNGFEPGTETYRSLTLSAIAHTLAAIAFFLEPVPEPEVPGLPPGWKIGTRQAPDGERRWGYELTAPGTSPEPSRYRWGSSEAALTAGIRYARLCVSQAQLEAEDDGPDFNRPDDTPAWLAFAGVPLDQIPEQLRDNGTGD